MNNAVAIFSAALMAATLSIGLQDAPAQPNSQAAAGDLRPAADFVGIADRNARSIALFQEAGKVLQHPRCVNCHPAGDSPHQTDQRRPHQPLVVRGADGHGAPTLACNTCHGPANFDPAHVPGHPEWHLAPLAMAWEGRSLGQICEPIDVSFNKLQYSHFGKILFRIRKIIISLIFCYGYTLNRPESCAVSSVLLYMEDR